MLKNCHQLKRKPKTADELKVALQTIWEELPQEHINKVVVNLTKLLTAYVAVVATGVHFEHLSILSSASTSHHQPVVKV